MNLLTALDQDIEIVIRRNAPLAEDWSDQRRRSLIEFPMEQKRKFAPGRPRTFEAARRRVLTRFRKGLNLQWTPPASRDEVHDRGSRRRDG